MRAYGRIWAAPCLLEHSPRMEASCGVQIAGAGDTEDRRLLPEYSRLQIAVLGKETRIEHSDCDGHSSCA